LSVFTSAKKVFIPKTSRAISCAVNFYNAGVVTLGRRIGSCNSLLFLSSRSCFFPKLPPYTPAGFELTTQNTAGGDYNTM
jgi:hypothetical protein